MSANSSSLPPFDAPDVLAQQHAIDKQLRAWDISVSAITAVIVVLRLWARSKSTAGYGTDDWLIVFAGIIMFVNLALNIVVIKNGLGMHMSELSPDELRTIAKLFYADEMIYIVSITLVKISILIMYCRIFALRSFQTNSGILGGITVLWSVVFFFACIFQCAPIEKAWNPMPGKCISLHALFIGNAIPNIVTDAIILVLPIYQVWKLHVRFLQRATLTMIFLLGSFVVFSAIHRLVTLMRFDQNNLSYTLKELITWTHMEICMAIISACLPCMRPLVKSFREFIGRGSKTPQVHELNWSGSAIDPRRIGFNKAEEDGISEPTMRSDIEEQRSDIGQHVYREDRSADRDTVARHHSIV